MRPENLPVIPETLEIDDDLVLRQFDVFDDIALFKLANRNRAELARYHGLIGIERLTTIVPARSLFAARRPRKARPVGSGFFSKRS